MKTMLAALIALSASLAHAGPLFDCKDTSDLGGHWFHKLSMHETQTTITTDVVSPIGEAAYMTVENRAAEEGTDVMTGSISYRDGQNCAGGCGAFTYKLQINPNQPTGTNAILHVTQTSYDENSGLFNERTTPYSYNCTYK